MGLHGWKLEKSVRVEGTQALRKQRPLSPNVNVAVTNSASAFLVSHNKQNLVDILRFNDYIVNQVQISNACTSTSIFLSFFPVILDSE
jgi:hypothetical protein